MSLLWIPFTIMAAFMQSVRNALQKQLSNHTSTLGVTLARFIIALPLSAIYLCLLYLYLPSVVVPEFSKKFFFCIFVAAVAQIFATALMVMLFNIRNYAIGVGLAKSEAVIAATLGALFFSAPLSLMAWCGVLIGAIAVWLMSFANAKSSIKDDGKGNIDSSEAYGLSIKIVVIGLASGLFFALCTLYIRESALILRVSFEQYGFLLSAAWVLFFVLLTQTLLLSFWIMMKEPQTFQKLQQHIKLTVSISLFSFLGSIGWFTAMSLQKVALVKTLGQIEVLFTLVISALYFKERLAKNDYLAFALIVIGAVLVIKA